jgi:hypothetical protein
LDIEQEKEAVFAWNDIDEVFCHANPEGATLSRAFRFLGIICDGFEMK